MTYPADFDITHGTDENAEPTMRKNKKAPETVLSEKALKKLLKLTKKRKKSVSSDDSSSDDSSDDTPTAKPFSDRQTKKTKRKDLKIKDKILILKKDSFKNISSHATTLEKRHPHLARSMKDIARLGVLKPHLTDDIVAAVVSALEQRLSHGWADETAASIIISRYLAMDFRNNHKPRNPPPNADTKPQA